MLDKQFAKISQVFAFALVIRITWKKKTYPAMDSLVYGEAGGINFILVEDSICKL